MEHVMENNLESLRLVEFMEYAVVFGVALVFALGLLRLAGVVR